MSFVVIIEMKKMENFMLILAFGALTTSAMLLPDAPITSISGIETSDDGDSQPIAVSDECQFDNVGDCIWIDVTSQGYSFDEARAFCESHGSEVAAIPNEETYDAVVDDVRSKIAMSPPWRWTRVWVGMTINPMTGEVNPENAFYSWINRYWPDVGSQTRKHIAISLRPAANTLTGMVNIEPTFKFRAVACWKPKTPGAAVSTTVPDASGLGTTVPATSASHETTSLPNGKDVSDQCKTENIGGCFWTDIGDMAEGSSKGYSFAKAREMCEFYGSKVAMIRNEETYNAIIEDVRTKMGDSLPSGKSTRVWVGMTIDPMTGKVKPENAFYSWIRYWPFVGSQNQRHNIAISISSSSGMINIEATTNYRMGVACWKPQNSGVDASTPAVATSTTTNHETTGSPTTIADEVPDSNLPYGEVSDRCKIENIGGCFWTEFSDQGNGNRGYNYAKAREICESHGSEVAVIPNEETYTDIIENARSHMAVSMPWARVWVGMTIDSTVGNFKPENAFYSWYSAYWPFIGSRYQNRKNIAITVRRSANAVVGMVNIEAISNYRMGVVCWMPPVADNN